MAALVHNQVGLPENLRKLLAVAVRSVQWSYAIFWALSPTQDGVLEWADGYYNGDIKTRKTVQAVELKYDRVGLQRSEQLRELYESLLEGEIDQQAKRPSAALSPEDLSDAEWYYLVCMSFVFNTGEGLPGRALANNQTIWLCNAQYADSKVFSRSLLAKSASIQTVVCFPCLDGVIELGVTELVMEDQSLIQHVKACLLDISKPVCSKSAPHKRDDGEDPIRAEVDNERVDALTLKKLNSSTVDKKVDREGINELPANMHDEVDMDSPDDCSNGCDHNHQTEDSLPEGLSGGASQVQSWHFMDDEFSNGVQNSMNSSDCISEAFVNQDKALSSPTRKNVRHIELKELQECNHTKLSSLDLGADVDLHYKRILSVILRGFNQFIDNSCFNGPNCKSSFVTWRRDGGFDGYRPQVQQNMLKKVLFAVPLMHGKGSRKCHKETGGKDCLWNSESNEICKGHDLSEKQRENENLLPSISQLYEIGENEKLLVLSSMVPSINKTDKALMLDDMITYLKELEARVEELESCMDLVDYETRPRRTGVSLVEQMSDNYENKKIINGKKPWLNKRKACDIDEIEPELNGVLVEDSQPLDVNVSMKEKEVVVDMRCPYREYILLDIMDEINHLHLDVHSVQSSTIDGILMLTLKSKFRGAAGVPARMIKQALCKIAG